MPQQRAYADMVRGLLRERQQKLCAGCGRELGAEQGRIHHIDGNPKNQAPSNLQLVHAACHVIPGRPHPVSVRPPLCARAGGGNDPHSAKQRLATGYADSDASPAMRASALAKPRFREWLTTYLREHGRLTRQEAIASGAEITGMDVTTVDRWVQALESLLGPIEKFIEAGEWQLRLREG